VDRPAKILVRGLLSPFCVKTLSFGGFEVMISPGHAGAIMDGRANWATQTGTMAPPRIAFCLHAQGYNVCWHPGILKTANKKCCWRCPVATYELHPQPVTGKWLEAIASMYRRPSRHSQTNLWKRPFGCQTVWFRLRRA
jgi:hypothetical protein